MRWVLVLIAGEQQEEWCLLHPESPPNGSGAIAKCFRVLRGFPMSLQTRVPRGND